MKMEKSNLNRYEQHKLPWSRCLVYIMKIYNKIKLSDLYVNKIDSVEINLQNFNKQKSKISASEADKY